MKKYFPLLLKLVAAVIMLQTLYIKFTGEPETIDLFPKLTGNNEAYMRIGTGILELIAYVFLFVWDKRSGRGTRTQLKINISSVMSGVWCGYVGSEFSRFYHVRGV